MKSTLIWENSANRFPAKKNTKIKKNSTCTNDFWEDNLYSSTRIQVYCGMRSFLGSRHSRFIVTGLCFDFHTTDPMWQSMAVDISPMDPIQTCIIISHTLFKTLTARPSIKSNVSFFSKTETPKLDKNWIILFFPWHSEDRLIKIQFFIFFGYFICKQRPTKVLYFCFRTC